MPFPKIENAIKRNNEKRAYELVSKEMEILNQQICELDEISVRLAKNPNPDLVEWLTAAHKKYKLENRGIELRRIINKCDKKWGDR